jgi:hypothetical protein
VERHVVILRMAQRVLRGPGCPAMSAGCFLVVSTPLFRRRATNVCNYWAIQCGIVTLTPVFVSALRFLMEVQTVRQKTAWHGSLTVDGHSSCGSVRSGVEGTRCAKLSTGADPILFLLLLPTRTPLERLALSQSCHVGWQSAARMILVIGSSYRPLRFFAIVSQSSALPSWNRQSLPRFTTLLRFTALHHRNDDFRRSCAQVFLPHLLQ